MPKKQQYLVIGMGRFGSSLAKELCSLGHEVLAVDHSEAVVSDIAPFVTQAVEADATDDEVLAEFDVPAYDAVVVAIGSNLRDSILISVLCKEAGAKLLIAKALDDIHAKILEKIGVDRVIFPERDMGRRVARTLAMPRTIDLMAISSDKQIAEVVLPSGWEGKTLAQLGVRRKWGVTILAVRRGREVKTNINADSVLEPKDILLLLGTQEEIDAIERISSP